MHNREGISTDQPANEVPRMHVAWKGAAIMLVVIVGFYVLREHWGHALGVAPYLLLLACPLMHIFMHGGHGRDHVAGDKENRHRAEAATAALPALRKLLTRETK